MSALAHRQLTILGARHCEITRWLSASVMCVCLVTSADRALAENSGTDEKALQVDDVLEEVLVTAQKREQRAFDVPISIVAMGDAELQKREITSVNDLGLAVPGLSIVSSGTLQRQIALRGISNGFGNSSTIGMYLDEAPVTSNPNTQLDLRTYDLERVEVLRGPQGTLYGEGSVGGTIRFITKNPQLDRVTMSTDVAALFTKNGAPGQRIEGAINVPLVENELGLRIAGTFNHGGGWIDQPAADHKDFNDENLVNVRVKGLWQPVPQFTLNAMAVIHRNDAPPSNREDTNGNFTQVFNLTTTPDAEDDYDLYNLTLTYDFTSVRILSATSYIEQNKEVRNYGSTRQFTPPETPPFDLYLPVFPAYSDSFSEELRLTSLDSGPWQWTLGGFFRRFQFDQPYSYHFGFPGAPGTGLPAPFLFNSRSLSKSWAVFGDASYELTNLLTLGAGLRYFEDDQEYATGGVVLDPSQTGQFHTLNPRIYVQYKLSEFVNTYASAAKGFRSGGFNALDRPKYDPESIWTYELGTKMLLPRSRLTIDLAAFYSDYEDYQIIGVVQGSSGVLVNITSNAGTARIRGVEGAITWRPVDQWSLSFGGAYADAEFVTINATSSSHVVGDPLDSFPKYQYTASAQHDFTWRGREGLARLDYNQQSRMTYRNRNVAGPSPWYFSQSDIINMLNFNASVQWSETLSLGLFAQNLLDDRGFTSPATIDGVAARSRPRTFGIQFGVTFD